MKSTSLHVFFLFTSLLLVGCPQETPGSDKFACLKGTCADSHSALDATISKSDSKISNPDSTIDITQPIDTKIGTCPDPNNMPDSCKPAAASMAKCQNNICDSWFLKDSNCTVDSDCQKMPSYETSESKAKLGTCTGHSSDTCEKYGWKCSATSAKAGQDCNTDTDCQEPVCENGWLAGTKCTTDTICQTNPIPPCSCWSFCKFFGKWKSESLELDFVSMQENNGICLIVNSHPPATNYAGKIGNSTIESGSSELRFDEYCEKTTANVASKLGSCAMKETCREGNYCGLGKCNGAHDCTSTQDCSDIPGTSCQNQKCSFSGYCSKDQVNSPDNCPAVYAPCIAADETHLIQKVCDSKKICNEFVFTKSN